MSSDQVSIKEAVKITGKSTNTIRNWIKDGKIVATKDGKVWLIKRDSLKAAAGKRKRKKKAAKKPVAVDQTQKLNNEIIMLKAQLAQVKEDNERLQDKEKDLKDRIRQVFGKVLSPLIEKLLEIE